MKNSTKSRRNDGGAFHTVPHKTAMRHPCREIETALQGSNEEKVLDAEIWSIWSMAGKKNRNKEKHNNR